MSEKVSQDLLTLLDKRKLERKLSTGQLMYHRELGREEEPRTNPVYYREVIATDKNGEVVYDVVSRPRHQNGGGFVISYSEKMCDFLVKCSVSSTIRVFLYIAHHQQYGNDGTQYGYRCSHKHLRQVLNLDKKTVYSALQYLKNNFLVNEMRIDGQVEFMVHPDYVTIGTDKKKRMKEWSRRWEMHWKRVHADLLKKASEGLQV